MSKFIGPVLGYRKDGRPVYGVRGGSTPAPPETDGAPAPTPNEPPARRPSRTFSEEDLESARKQEKDKLYPRIDALSEQLRVLEEDRAARVAAEEEARATAAEEERKRQEAELSAKELLEQKDKQWTERFEQLQREQAAREALFEKERQFNELMSYRAQAIAANAEMILPELQDEVSGNTKEQIDASIARLAAKSESIIGNVQQSLNAVPGTPPPSAPRTTSPTGFNSSGPLEDGPSQQTITPQDIAAMTWDEYSEYRKKAGIGQSNHGMF